MKGLSTGQAAWVYAFGSIQIGTIVKIWPASVQVSFMLDDGSEYVRGCVPTFKLSRFRKDNAEGRYCLVFESTVPIPSEVEDRLTSQAVEVNLNNALVEARWVVDSICAGKSQYNNMPDGGHSVLAECAYFVEMLDDEA
ncbi:MAG: hypothetical protein JSW10_00450 [Pseudomonadota bacterium]|nr:MAG: hypothetical protein JSW10_00450 [Pseudomonadota bacterium]